MGTRVRAITAGSVDGQRVRPGKEFVLRDGLKPGKWLEVLEENVGALTKSEAKAKAKADADAKKKEEADRLKQGNDANRNITTPAPATPAEDLA